MRLARWPRLKWWSLTSSRAHCYSTAVLPGRSVVQGPLAADQKTPSWMVVSARLRLSGEMQAMPLEFRMANTSLEEEGAGFISRTRLLEACCRHFLVWLHKWEEDGFRPVHDMWSNRAERQVELRTSDGRVADWLGLDEGGQAC